MSYMSDRIVTFDRYIVSIKWHMSPSYYCKHCYINVSFYFRNRYAVSIVTITTGQSPIVRLPISQIIISTPTASKIPQKNTPPQRINQSGDVFYGVPLSKVQYFVQINDKTLYHNNHYLTVNSIAAGCLRLSPLLDLTLLSMISVYVCPDTKFFSGVIANTVPSFSKL